MPGSIFRPLTHSLTTLSSIARDLVHLLILVSRSRRALAAENLFLRKQLALFQERKVKPRRAHDSTRLIMVILSRLFVWRDALVNVQPDTFIRWHRKGFRLLWRWKSRPPGRPRIPKDLRRLIREMAAENPTWGEERIANELNLKLTIRVSPRTVGKYLRKDSPVRTPDPKQRWLTFVHNHSKVMVACDFFVVITATFGPSTSSLSWRSDPARFFTRTSRPIPRRNGRCSNSGKPCRTIIRIVSSSTIATASSQRLSTRVLPIWGYGFCVRECGPRRRTRCANDSAAAFVANVSTS